MQEEVQALEASKAELQAKLQATHGVMWHKLSSQQALLTRERELKAYMKAQANAISQSSLPVQPKDRSKPTNATERLARMYVYAHMCRRMPAIATHGCSPPMLPLPPPPRPASRERNRINARKARQRRRIKLEELHLTVELLKRQVGDLQHWIDAPAGSAELVAARRSDSTGDVHRARGAGGRGSPAGGPRVDTADPRPHGKSFGQLVAGSGGSPGTGHDSPRMGAAAAPSASSLPRRARARGLASITDAVRAANAAHARTGFLPGGMRAAGGSHLTPRESRPAFPSPARASGTISTGLATSVSVAVATSGAQMGASSNPANSPMSADPRHRVSEGGTSTPPMTTTVASINPWVGHGFDAAAAAAAAASPASQSAHLNAWATDMMFGGSPRPGMPQLPNGPGFPAMLAAWGGMNALPGMAAPGLAPHMFGGMSLPGAARFGAMQAGGFGWDAGTRTLPPHLQMAYALSLAQARASSGQVC